MATNNLGKEVDLIISLPEGGTVRFMNGVGMIDSLAASVLDFTRGWYAPGWVEPADLPVADKPPEEPQEPPPVVAEPEPEDVKQVAILFGRSGNALKIHDRDGAEVPLFL